MTGRTSRSGSRTPSGSSSVRKRTTAPSRRTRASADSSRSTLDGSAHCRSSTTSTAPSPVAASRMRRPPASTRDRRLSPSSGAEDTGAISGRMLPSASLSPRRRGLLGARIECERLTEHRPRQAPGLGLLGAERPGRDDRQVDAVERLGDQPGLARARRTGHGRDPSLGDHAAERGDLTFPADEPVLGDRHDPRAAPPWDEPGDGRCRCGQRLAAQQPQLQLLGLRGQVDPEFVGEASAQVGDPREGGRRVAAGGQRPGQEQDQGLPEGVGGDGLRGVLGGDSALPEPERGSGGDLERVDPGREQTVPGLLRPVGVEVLGERIRPEVERGEGRAQGAVQVTGARGPSVLRPPRRGTRRRPPGTDPGRTRRRR